MKRITILVLLICMFVFALPVAAAPKSPVGEQIDLRGGQTEFQAGTAFHIAQGWVF